MSDTPRLRHDVHVDVTPLTRTEWSAPSGMVGLEVELELGDVPVGRLHGRGFDHAFVGWMELMAAFEDALAALRSTERSAAVGEPGLSGATSSG